jgi:hypothetical protein
MGFARGPRHPVKGVHIGLGMALLALFGAAAALGAWRWRAGDDTRTFWRLLRAGQALLVVQAALGGALLLAGRRVDDLHLVYGLVPLGVSFAAEQLRVSAAETVLDARGIASAQAVGELPEAEQRRVVRAILQRELGVMVVAALVITGLLLRAAFSSGGL